MTATATATATAANPTKSQLSAFRAVCHTLRRKWTSLRALPVQDVESLFSIEFLKCVQTFDPSRNIAFGAYLSRILHLRAGRIVKREEPKEASLESPEESIFFEEDSDSVDFRLDLQEVTEELPDRDAYLLQAVFVDGEGFDVVLGHFHATFGPLTHHGLQQRLSRLSKLLRHRFAAYAPE